MTPEEECINCHGSGRGRDAAQRCIFCGGTGGRGASNRSYWNDKAPGIYPDPEHPGRLLRKGRGQSPRRVVRRVTVYIEDELATALDVRIARGGKRVTRSGVIEAALLAYLKQGAQ